jgi:EAL domain-containing protein (putative c-di-GMP-specific phosphodiesterase class I)
MDDYDRVEEGLKNGEFFLEYLPTVELDSGRCIGAEALSRWRRPWGVAKPADFLPQIENTALAGLLTYWVLEQIAQDFLSWLKVHDAFISFNAPPEIIGRGGMYFVAEKSGLMDVKDKIIVEITERGVPDGIAVESLSRAVERGFRLALDDVGIGGASLLVLARCNVEMVKLDRHLVARMCGDQPLPGNLDALAALLKTGTLKVVAEGVESAEQAEAIGKAGVRLAQGYHFSRPLSAEAFKTYFAENRAA